MVIFALVFLSVKESSAQNTPPEFPNCDKTVISLCTDDPGVILPPSNKIYLEETDPLATSCSVHLSQSETGIIDCGTQIFYEVDLFLFDNSDPIKLLNSTLASVDENGEVELSFNSSMSPDSILAYNGIPYNDICGPAHRVRWTVTDSCGQSVICNRFIRIYDCYEDSLQPGTPPFIQLGCCNPQINVSPEDYFAIDDDCWAAEDYLFSYSENSYKPDSIFDACNSGFGILVPADVWIASGGIDYDCNGNVTWEERSKNKVAWNVVFLDDGCIHCPMEESTVKGYVKTHYGKGIKNVNVHLHKNGLPIQTTITDSDGAYSFQPVQIGIELKLTLDKNVNHSNGVSTLDLVRMVKDRLGLEPFTDPYTTIAADVNRSQTLNVIDIVETRKLILHIQSQFYNNTSWRFVLADYIFPTPSEPWPVPEDFTITTMPQGLTVDFIGIKIGDVNQTVNTDQ